MTTTYIDAIDEIYNLFKTTLAAVSASVGITPEVRYHGKDGNTVPPVASYFIEVTQTTGTDRQVGFGVSSRLYETRGVLTLRIYAPQIATNSFAKGRKLADGLKRGYRPRQSAGSVWFRNARVQELAPDKGAYRFNVVVDYTYTERQ